MSALLASCGSLSTTGRGGSGTNRRRRRRQILRHKFMQQFGIVGGAIVVLLGHTLKAFKEAAGRVSE